MLSTRVYIYLARGVEMRGGSAVMKDKKRVWKKHLCEHFNIQLFTHNTDLNDSSSFYGLLLIALKGNGLTLWKSSMLQLHMLLNESLKTFY